MFGVPVSYTLKDKEIVSIVNCNATYDLATSGKIILKVNYNRSYIKRSVKCAVKGRENCTENQKES